MQCTVPVEGSLLRIDDAHHVASCGVMLLLLMCDQTQPMMAYIHECHLTVACHSNDMCVCQAVVCPAFSNSTSLILHCYK